MKISIQSPCHENWSEMTPNEQGRHCQICAKTVHDFTQMSDAGILHFFRQNSNVCGKFQVTQLNRPLNPSFGQVFKYGMMACAFIGLAPLTLNAQDLLQNTDTVTAQKPSWNFNQSVLKIQFEQAATIHQQIQTLILSIDSFKIKVMLDSSNQCSIHLPETVSDSSAHIDLIQNNGLMTSLTIGSIKTFKSLVFYQTNGNWSYYQPLQFDPTQIRYESMGIPMTWGYTVTWPMPQVHLTDPLDTIHLLGDTIIQEATMITSPRPSPKVLHHKGLNTPDHKKALYTKLVFFLLLILSLGLLAYRHKKRED